MTALVLMQHAGGWAVFCDGARINHPLGRGVALELAIRLAQQKARAGEAVNLVIDGDPDGPGEIGFRMEPEPTLCFRPPEPRSFDAGEVISPPARSPPG